MFGINTYGIVKVLSYNSTIKSPLHPTAISSARQHVLELTTVEIKTQLHAPASFAIVLEGNLVKQLL